MNWENIIIAISSSLITATIGLIGNIIVINKRNRHENKETVNQYEQKYYEKRFAVYSQLATELEIIKEYNDKIESIKTTKFFEIYANNNLVLNNEIREKIKILIKVYNENKYISSRCETLIREMKNEIESYYKINNIK